MRTGVRPWSEIEELHLDGAKLPLDTDKNPLALKCLFCDGRFRFEDQVIAHTWAKHRKLLLHEIVNLRAENAELTKAMKVYRDLARGK